jgi:hypothetical protein
VGDGKGQRMSPVQASGGKGSGQGQGSGQGSKPGFSRPAQKPGAKKTAPKGKSSPRPPGAGGGKGKTGKSISAPEPSRFSPSTMAFIAVGIVVVIVLVIVVVKVAGGGSTTSSVGPPDTPATASVVSAVTGDTTSMANQVGVPSSVTAPKVAKNQPVLTLNGLPGVLAVLAKFCPYCAAERWSIVIALAPFGTWSGLYETTSSAWDTDPSTATFAFDHATFTSQYVTFVGKEVEGNDTTGPGTRKPLQQLTSQESGLWAKYSAFFGLSGEGFPFLDIGNQFFVTGPSFDPAVLAGLTQSDIAGKLTNPQDPVTQAIFGTVNYIRASVCSVTGQQPSSVCSQSGVKAAAHAMGLS